MTDNKSLYICNNYCILIFENRETLARVGVTAFYAHDGPGTVEAFCEAMEHADIWRRNSPGGKVSLCMPGEPILLIKKENALDHEHWNVVVGENVGWFSMREWMEIVPLVKGE